MPWGLDNIMSIIENEFNATQKRQERIYILQEFYNLKLGLALLQYNIALAKQNQQTGL